MTHYSYSQVRMHQDCPRRYWYEYRSQHKPPLPHAIYGQGQRAEDDLLHIMEHDPGRVHDQHPKLATLLENFFPDGTREPMRIPFLAYEVLCHTDYHYVESTSGFLLDFKLAQLPADDLQLRIYALAMHVLYGVTTVRAWYYVIERGFYASYHYDAATFEATQRELLAACDAIHEKGSEKANYEPRPTIKCETCPYATECEGTDKYALELPKTEEEAAAIYGRMKRMEASADRAKELLTLYMEHNALSELAFDQGGRLRWQLSKPSLREYKK